MREYIWVDDMPLAVRRRHRHLRRSSSYVHADHLNRPLQDDERDQSGGVGRGLSARSARCASITGIGGDQQPALPGAVFPVGVRACTTTGTATTTRRWGENWRRDPLEITFKQMHTESFRSGTRRHAMSVSALGDASRRYALINSTSINTGAPRKIGEFVGRDRSKIDFSDFLDGPSLYAYVRSRPTMSVDFTGLLIGPIAPIPLEFAGPQCTAPEPVALSSLLRDKEYVHRRCSDTPCRQVTSDLDFGIVLMHDERVLDRRNVRHVTGSSEEIVNLMMRHGAEQDQALIDIQPICSPDDLRCTNR